MADDVRYKPNGDNSVLRHLLCEVWELQCYWCREFKKYLELQIDHIVPQRDSDAERQRLQEAFKLDSDYDVHAVENLAPICTPCNGRKSNADMTQYPVVLTCLKKARQHAPTVVKRFRAFTAPANLGGALLTAVSADLADADIRAAFEIGAPAIVQRLSELGSGKADYLVHRDVVTEGKEQDHAFSISLNEQGRTAMAMLQGVAGGELEEALKEPIIDLFQQVRHAIAREYRAKEDRLGEPGVGSVEIEWPMLVVQRMACTATPPAQLLFEFEGAFDGLATASVLWSSFDGSELEDVQGDASFSCRFNFELSWEPGNPAGSFSFDEVWMEDFEAETLVHSKRSEDAWDWPEEPVDPNEG